MEIKKTQKEWVEEILKLLNDNPGMEIKFCVDNETLCEGTGWTEHRIFDVKITDWYQADEYIYTEDWRIIEYFYEECVDDGLTHEEANFESERLAKAHSKKVIAIYTTA